MIQVYECEYCGEMFKNRDDCFKHEIEKHEGTERYYKAIYNILNELNSKYDMSKNIDGQNISVDMNLCVCDGYEYIENYMRPRAEREGKEFSITIDKNVGKGYFDENRLKQVLSNIIDNAFKFTEENGKISLNTKVEEEYLVFRVKDNGSGISSKDLPRVKDKFYKGKNSKSRNGIGLSICDEIVTLHRGILEIISKENEGTEIIIKIPLNQGET